jgi:hypothetical protein
MWNNYNAAGGKWSSKLCCIGARDERPTSREDFIPRSSDTAAITNEPAATFDEVQALVVKGVLASTGVGRLCEYRLQSF